MRKKILSVALAAAMTTTMLAGCGGGSETTTTTTTTASGDTQASETSAEGDTTTAAETTAAGTEETTATDSGSNGDTPLVAGYSTFSQKFSPFFAQTQYDMDASDLTQTYLLTTDRAGGIIYKAIEGETTEYNGNSYTYTGSADIQVDKDDEKNETVYTIKMRDDIKFGDGEPANIDDVIFTFYALSDNDYDGSSTVYSLPVKGMKAYRLNSSAADSISEDDVTAAIDKMDTDLAKAVNELMNALLTGEMDWAKENWETYKDDYKVKSAQELFAKIYSTDEKYSVKDKDDDTIIADVLKMYGKDYKKLATAYGDETYFDADVKAAAEQVLVDQKMAKGEGTEVANISGLERVDDYTLKVTTDGYEATTIYTLSIPIAPLHYYGDKAKYNYEKNEFGFTRGDLTAIREKTKSPLGAGPYKFVKYDNKTVYYEANENYYKGAPKTKSLQLKETDDADKIPGVQQGTIDLTDPDGSKAAFEQISGINSSKELSGDTIVTSTVDNLGYGYIGINADTVRVGDTSDSDESKALRKAIMTVFSVYRDEAIDTYYGDAAAIINYPISNTSWAAPQKSDSDYQVAYSTNKDGEAIYKDGMSADDKYKAALEAALGYFEAAGYTVKDGKLTAAPKGAKMDYEIIIPAEGNGDHPDFSLLTSAKAAFESIGLTLNINDPTDSNVLWDAINAGTQEMWCAAWQATIDPDMYQVYDSSNIPGKGGTNSNNYHIADADLDELIINARSSDDQSYRKQVYKQCLDLILEWGVELPVYQRQNCVIYSPERINEETMTKDVTPFYRWLAEIEKIEMK